MDGTSSTIGAGGVGPPAPGDRSGGRAELLDTNRESVPRVSVVIVSWNTRQLLLDALASFLPFQGVSGEVIVVDNASEDGSPEAVEEQYPDVRLIRSDRNLGFAGGVNVGLRAAEHPYVLLLNTDTTVVGNALEALIAYAEAHPEAGIVGPRVLNADGTLQDSRFRFPSIPNLILASTYLYKLFPRSSLLNRERHAGSDPMEARPVDAVSGCCFLIRQEALERVGLLDESYFMYAEETDLCFRAWSLGFEVHYAPVGEIVHLGGGSSRLMSRRTFLEYRRSILRFFHKHRGRASTEAARWLLMLFLLLRIPYWALCAWLWPDPDRTHRGQLENYLAGMRFLWQPTRRILERPVGGAWLDPSR